jgi:hypothetical protein
VLQIISVIVTVIGAIGGPVTGYLIFRQGQKPRKLGYDIQQRPSFPRNDGQASDFKIEIDGSPVADPHEVTLYLRPTGSKDIRLDDFQDDLRLKLGAKLVAVLDRVGLKDGVGEGADDREIKIERQLLKRNKLFEVSAIVDGDPAPKLIADLADVDLVKFDINDTDRETIVGRRTILAALTVGLVAMVIGGWVGWIAALQVHRQQRQLDQTQDRYNGLLQQVGSSATGLQSALPNDPEAAAKYSAELQKVLKQYGAINDIKGGMGKLYGPGGTTYSPGYVSPPPPSSGPMSPNTTPCSTCVPPTP